MSDHNTGNFVALRCMYTQLLIYVAERHDDPIGFLKEQKEKSIIMASNYTISIDGMETDAGRKEAIQAIETLFEGIKATPINS